VTITISVVLGLLMPAMPVLLLLVAVQSAQVMLIDNRFHSLKGSE